MSEDVDLPKEGRCLICGCFLEFYEEYLGESGNFNEMARCNNPRCRSNNEGKEMK
jgi:hypothetical protein